jgi:hypothetical protein
VKIGQLGLESSRPIVPEEFDRLSSDFFSLGQDDSYYQRLNELGYETAEEILRSLNDVAFDLDLFERVLRHRVTGVSLLRNVSWTTVRNQFHRVARAGTRRTTRRPLALARKPTAAAAGARTLGNSPHRLSARTDGACANRAILPARLLLKPSKIAVRSRFQFFASRHIFPSSSLARLLTGISAV